MNILMTALNSSYTHTALAIHTLSQSIALKTGFKPTLLELTINGRYNNMLSDVFEKKPDILCLSCYIWNIEFIKVLLRDIKKILPKCTIICGGPEVSYNAIEFLKEHPTVDYIVAGEGEESLADLIRFLSKDKCDSFTMPANICYRRGDEIIENNTVGVLSDLDCLCFPYDEQYLSDNPNRIFYCETSRGCPYSCSYCISSIDKTYRKKSLNKVFEEINIFTKNNVKLLKFTDRTFNADKKRACDILEYIASLDTKTRFHFEIAADILDYEIINILNTMPVGRVQLEAGIQTTNKDTMKAICRNISFEKSRDNLSRIIQKGNVHVHTDLIAGLPYEDKKSFSDSFNDVYFIGGHHLQLGFLKLLKGTSIKDEYDNNNSGYTEQPPYEVLNTPWLSYEELLFLKNTEAATERFYNSKNFSLVTEYMTKTNLIKPFELYSTLGEYMKSNGYLDRPLSALECYDVFIGFVKNIEMPYDELKIIMCLIKIDMASSFVFRKLPKKYKDYMGYQVVKKDADQDANRNNVKTYLLDEDSINILNEKKETFKSLNIFFKDIFTDVFVNAIQVDYSKKNSVTERFNANLISINI